MKNYNNNKYKNQEKNWYERFFITTDYYGSYISSIQGEKSQGTTKKEPLKKFDLEHDVIGAHTIKQDKAGYICFDIDVSKQTKLEFLNSETTNFRREKTQRLELTNLISDYLDALSIPNFIEDSIGGFHIWIFLDNTKSKLAYVFCQLVKEHFKDYDFEAFPKQPNLEKGSLGNWVRIPGRYHSLPKGSKEPLFSRIQVEKGKWQEIREQEAQDFILSFPIVSQDMLQEAITKIKKEQEREREIKKEKERELEDRELELQNQLKLIRIEDIFSKLGYSLSPNARRFRCPYHDDKHPSGSIFPHHTGVELFKCFSPACLASDKAYSALTLLTKLENMEFKEALSFLGIELKGKGKGKEKRGESKEGKKVQEIILEDGKRTFLVTIGKKRETREELANFVMSPISKIQMEDGIKWEMELDGVFDKKIIFLHGTELTNLQKFCDVIGKHGSFFISYNSKKIHKLFLEHCIQKGHKEKQEISYLGRVGEKREYVTNLGFVTPRGVEQRENIVFPTGKFKISTTGDIKEAIKVFIDVYGSESWKALGFAAASIFYKEIVEEFGFFPILFLNGEKSKGKTTLANFISGFFGTQVELKPLTFDSTTKAWQRLASRYKGIPIIIDDYKPSKKNNSVLCALYDREGYIRAKTDNTLETYETKIESTFIIISTRFISEHEASAVQSRLVTLNIENIKRDITKIQELKRKNRKGELSLFLPLALELEPKEILTRVIDHQNDLEQEYNVGNERIVLNHCLFFEFGNALFERLGFPAIERQYLVESMFENIETTEAVSYARIFMQELLALIGEKSEDSELCKLVKIEEPIIWFAFHDVYSHVLRFMVQQGKKDILPDRNTLKKDLIRVYGPKIGNKKIKGCSKWTMSINLLMLEGYDNLDNLY